MAKNPAMPQPPLPAIKQNNGNQPSVVSQLSKSAMVLANIHKLMKNIARANRKKSIEIAKASAEKVCANAAKALKNPVPDTSVEASDKNTKKDTITKQSNGKKPPKKSKLETTKAIKTDNVNDTGIILSNDDNEDKKEITFLLLSKFMNQQFNLEKLITLCQ